MSEFVVRLAFDLVVVGTAALLACLYYHLRISRPAKLVMFQYRLFALRDRAIGLVVDGVMNKEDPRWNNLYKHLNYSAKLDHVYRMKNGLYFTLALLRHATPPTEEEIRSMESLPLDAKKLMIDYVDTVLGICWQGSLVLRLCVSLARILAFKKLLERARPQEASHYRGFVHSRQQLCAA